MIFIKFNIKSARVENDKKLASIKLTYSESRQILFVFFSLKRSDKEKQESEALAKGEKGKGTI